ncbi:hypothetical protein BCR43DRAFT_519377 [Syncephalastrum racemosum]|uniref:Uncharacterized protein n=1 Tax=Syncephalastrum racemosum TaxID=13706 RepID=A0A1X2GZ37_SYNRA|nr:hypothetical protein BCR43DRAFT_519377 [Syncephalastrum racemosum]
MSPLLNWPVPNVAAKAVLFPSLLLRRTAPFFTQEVYPRVTSRSTVGRKSLAPKKDSQMKWKRNTVSFLSIVAFASIEEQQPLKFVVTRPLRNDALDRTHTLATAFDLAHK